MEINKAWHVHDEMIRGVARRLDIPEEGLHTLIDGVRRLGRLLIAFSGVNRDSQLDREGTHESDTDHTVILAVVACAVAAKYLPELDLGRLAQYALVHDLVEA